MSAENPAQLSPPPTTHPECSRPSCRLRTIDLQGGVECLMDAVKEKWQDPSAINYCTDPSCKKFIDLLNARPPFQGS